MILNFIFVVESATYGKLGVLGGLTRFSEKRFKVKTAGTARRPSPIEA